MILITNDDGVFSTGIRSIWRSLLEAGMEIAVVAPSRERSGSGMAITLSGPIEFKKISIDGYKAYSVDGTPADCVMLALDSLFRNKIGMVVSGINAGVNAGFGIIFNSGTISAAMMGAMNGIPSFAFSQQVDSRNHTDPSVYERGAAIAKRMISEFLGSGRRVAEVINVNFPENVTSSTGTVEVPFSEKPLYYRNVILDHQTENGGVFRIETAQRKPHPSGVSDDISALLGAGLISVTRIKMNKYLFRDNDLGFLQTEDTSHQGN